MTAVALIFKRRHPRAVEAAARVVSLLEARDVRVLLTTAQQQALGLGVATPEADLGREASFLVCLGGDGTLLHAAGLLRDHPIPVLGINLGRLGFLTPYAEEELETALAAALEGRLEVQERMRLEVTLRRGGGDDLAGLALNDAVISQGALARLLEVEARLDGKLITVYRADGLIISTPTGSTAYNLAAGGPLLTPGLDAVCITPICPHTLTNRSLVVPAGSVITVQVLDNGEKPYLTIDGQRGYILDAGDEVIIARAKQPLPLLMVPERGIFELMRSKLSWSGAAGM